MTEQDNPDNDIMCDCSGTKRKQIRELFMKGMDQQAISQWTGAMSGCGGCEWNIEDYLEELAQQKEAPDSPE